MGPSRPPLPCSALPLTEASAAGRSLEPLGVGRASGVPVGRLAALPRLYLAHGRGQPGRSPAHTRGSRGAHRIASGHRRRCRGKLRHGRPARIQGREGCRLTGGSRALPGRKQERGSHRTGVRAVSAGRTATFRTECSSRLTYSTSYAGNCALSLWPRAATSHSGRPSFRSGVVHSSTAPLMWRRAGVQGSRSGKLRTVRVIRVPG